MILKRILRPDRLRQIPTSFSWVDHRLVREQCLQGREPSAWALYLFLVTVADAQGLSYYSDAGIGKVLPLDGPALARVRQELIRARLIVYEKPLYQVLSLDKPDGPPRRAGPRLGVPQTLGQIIGEMELPT